ncbi:MAG: polyprenyl synthetase family protein [Thermaerobacter sp.]|nr:polyprenyl synthetase family protein [Thermaerobacter sp.]
MALFSTIEPQMREVSQILVDTLKSDNPLVALVADFVLAASGKQLRPALVLLASQFGEQTAQTRQNTVWVAAAAEMIHMATLIHDDIIDEATIRRGQQAVRSRFSDPVAVLAGDYLFAQAFRLFARTGQPEIIALAAKVVEVMCVGEIAQHLDQGRVATEAEYWQRIEAKTGFFLEASCRLGGLASQAADGVRDVLGRFGHHIGLAFQVVDDLLDWLADPQKLGKAVGGDLAEGTYTLPIIYALQTESYRARVEGHLRSPDPALGMQGLRALLAESGALDYSRRQAEHHVREALSVVASLPSGQARDSLRNLADFVLAREY